jgi:hypothetical protein
MYETTYGITSAQLRPFKEAASSTARSLLDMLATARRERDPLSLTLNEVDRIVRWKLRDQYYRTQHLRAGWTDATIRRVTTQALATPVLPNDDDIEARISLLCSLRGIGLPVASSILALACPERHGVIDRLNWSILFGEERRSFRPAHYRCYLRALRHLADDLNATRASTEAPWTVQGVDIALWHYAQQRG